MQTKIDARSEQPKQARPRADLGAREEVRTAFRQREEHAAKPAQLPRFGPLPGEVFADEARFGSFN